MELKVTIEYRGMAAIFGRGAGITTKAMRAVLTKMAGIIAVDWHENMLPQHFLAAAESRYGYESRTKVYQLRKTKTKGHRNPISFSGRTQDAMTGFAEIRATARGFRVKMLAPPWIRPAGKPLKGQPDMGAELVAVTPQETIQMAKRLELGLLGELQNKMKKHILRLSA